MPKTHALFLFLSHRTRFRPAFPDRKTYHKFGFLTRNCCAIVGERSVRPPIRPVRASQIRRWRLLRRRRITLLLFTWNKALRRLFVPTKKKTVHRSPWSKEEVKELKTHSKARTPVAKIAKAMKRTEGALRRKAGILGIGLGHDR